MLKIRHNHEEGQYLDQMALSDLRTPEAVVRWLIRQEAQRRGLISSTPYSPNPLDNCIATPAQDLEATHAS